MPSDKKMVNVELHARDAEGDVCDTDNIDISEASASSIIDSATEIALLYQKHKDHGATEFYSEAAHWLEALEEDLAKAGIISKG